MSAEVFDVDGDAALVCGIVGQLSPKDRAAIAEVIRAARDQLAEMPGCPSGACEHLDQFHRSDGLCLVRKCSCGSAS